MASYKVVLMDKSDIRVTADDVEMDCCCGENVDDEGDDKCGVIRDHAFWNFTDKDGKTVAGIPFSQVLYITS